MHRCAGGVQFAWDARGSAWQSSSSTFRSATHHIAIRLLLHATMSTRDPPAAALPGVPRPAASQRPSTALSENQAFQSLAAMRAMSVGAEHLLKVAAQRSRNVALGSELPSCLLTLCRRCCAPRFEIGDMLLIRERACVEPRRITASRKCRPASDAGQGAALRRPSLQQSCLVDPVPRAVPHGADPTASTVGFL